MLDPPLKYTDCGESVPMLASYSMPCNALGIPVGNIYCLSHCCRLHFSKSKKNRERNNLYLQSRFYLHFPEEENKYFSLERILHYC